MSLKNFHVVFIVFAALCSLGFAAWALTATGEIVTSSVRASGWVSGGIGVALVLYGVWFITKKSKSLIV